MLHRTPLFIMAALVLALAVVQSAFAEHGAGTITARAQVISDRPSRDAQEAGEALLLALRESGGSSDAAPSSSLLVDGLSQLTIVTTAATPMAQQLVIEFVAN